MKSSISDDVWRCFLIRVLEWIHTSAPGSAATTCRALPQKWFHFSTRSWGWRPGEKRSDGTAVSSDVLVSSLISNTSLRSDSGCCVVLLHQLTSTQSEPNPDFIQFKEEDNFFLKLLCSSQGQAVFQGCAVRTDLWSEWMLKNHTYFLFYSVLVRTLQIWWLNCTYRLHQGQM